VKAICGIVEGVCGLICVFIKEILKNAFGLLRLDQPLGALMLLSLVFNVPAAWDSWLATYSSEVNNCREAPLGRFVQVDFLIAVGHIIFAAYIKRQVFRGPPPEDVDAFDAPAVPVNVDAEAPMPTAKEVGTRVKYLTLYDIGFCTYFFGMIASFVYQIFGFSYQNQCDLETWRPFKATLLLLIYPIMVLLYIPCFGCYYGVRAGVDVVGEAVGPNRQAGRTAADAAPYVALPSAPPGNVVPQAVQALRV